MTWIVGIDEAGYGPNLGPFVMTAVACQLPPERASLCLWQQLESVVRRVGKSRDDRLVIDDSKAVYSGSRGLANLERGVFTLFTQEPAHLAGLVEQLCPEEQEELAEECWYTGTSLLPAQARAEDLRTACARFQAGCKTASVQSWQVRSFVVCPRRFNASVQRADSKSIILGLGFIDLLRWAEKQGGEEPLILHSDKQGGRNHYELLIRQALLPTHLRTVEESPDCSSYQVECRGRSLHLTFQPRADTLYFCVALASMVSKYLRELLMAEFNRFWQQQVPGLKPTAGYPVDAARFLEAIRPSAEELGIPLESIWRQR